MITDHIHPIMGAWTFSAAIVADMAAPTLVSHGTAVVGSGYKLNYGLREMADITAATITVYGWDGTYWSWLQTTDWTSAQPLNPSDECDISNFSRYYVRVHGTAGGAGKTWKIATQQG